MTSPKTGRRTRRRSRRGANLRRRCANVRRAPAGRLRGRGRRVSRWSRPGQSRERRRGAVAAKACVLIERRRAEKRPGPRRSEGESGEKKGRSCDRPGGRKSGGEVVLAAKCGGEGGDVFERRTHVQRRSFENGALGAVPHHVLAGDDTYPSGRLGGDLRAGEVNRDLHGGRADRGDGGKCREGPGKINFVRPICVRRDLWGGN